jgi:hypothetical protein
MVIRGAKALKEVFSDGFKLDAAELLQETHAFEPLTPSSDDVFGRRSLKCELLVDASKFLLDGEPGLVQETTELAPHLEVVATGLQCGSRVGGQQLSGARTGRLVLEQVVHFRQ